MWYSSMGLLALAIQTIINFYTIKNGEMYGDDDRVITLLRSIDMMDRLIEYNFDNEYNYLNEVKYVEYEKKLIELQNKAEKFIENNVKEYYDETSE